MSPDKSLSRQQSFSRFYRRPSCDVTTDVDQYARRIGYYDLSALKRSCDTMSPESLAVGPLTHINIAFGLFDSEYKMIDDSGDIIRRISFLKARYSGLRVNIAIGGWAFNDPPTQNYFSDMASTTQNRQTFISSLISYLQKYGLDGVDIDWEYPAAIDRGGTANDTGDFVKLMADIRQAFDRINPGWEATITIPTSFWYLRGFDLPQLQEYVSWFNVMSYDLHGGWDKYNKFTRAYLEGHTNISEIDSGLDLLWRNGVDPKNVVIGYAFYGRSFTIADASCSKPGCKFSTTGRRGDCSGESGVLLYSEIVSRNTSLNARTLYDSESTVKYNFYDGNQWISYDDAQSFSDKKMFMSERCLSGLM